MKARKGLGSVETEGRRNKGWGRPPFSFSTSLKDGGPCLAGSAVGRQRMLDECESQSTGARLGLLQLHVKGTQVCTVSRDRMNPLRGKLRAWFSRRLIPSPVVKSNVLIIYQESYSSVKIQSGQPFRI